jgi:hypothetical protein
VDESGLNHCEVPVSDFGLTANVHVNAEQKRRAKMVKELHVLLNHPSDEKLIQLLDSGSLLNCPLTSRELSWVQKLVFSKSDEIPILFQIW